MSTSIFRNVNSLEHDRPTNLRHKLFFPSLVKNKAITIPMTTFRGSQHPCLYISLLLSDAFRKYFRTGQKQGLRGYFSPQTRLISPLLLNASVFILLCLGKRKGVPERGGPSSSGVTDFPYCFLLDLQTLNLHEA